MSNYDIHDHAPEVNLLLEVDASLNHLFYQEDSVREAMQDQISQNLTELLNVLGIPGKPKVVIIPLNIDPNHKGRFIRVLVNGLVCRYSDELLHGVYCYVKGIPLCPENQIDILAWLNSLSLCQTEQTKDYNIDFENFIVMACLEIINKQPAVLFGLTQTAAYLGILNEQEDGTEVKNENWPPEALWLRQVMGNLLNQRISIADTEKVKEVIKEGLIQKRSPDDIVENLIASLRKNDIEILLPTDYLREITLSDTESGHDHFQMLRDGLFYELGILFPDFHFKYAANLKPNSFSFRINHLSTLPRIGLKSHQYLVNDTVDRLKPLNIQGIPVINPANGNECSIIDNIYGRSAESAGLTLWDQLGYLILNFSEVLRENSQCFIHREAVKGFFEQLRLAFPTLVQIVHDRYSIEQITRILRLLIAEKIPVRNLRLILERLLDYDYIISDPSQYIIFDDRLPVLQEPDQTWINDPRNITAFVRTGMKRQISYKYTRGGNTMVVYLLDPRIEKMLANRPILPSEETGISQLNKEEENDKILAAVHDEIENRPNTSVMPVILTTIDVRMVLHQILAPDFPRLAVIGYQELSPDLNIQPIARIDTDT